MANQIDRLTFFKPILPGEYRRYGIDLLPPSEEVVDWYVHPTYYHDDGPWLVLAFLKRVQRSDVLTFNISYYDGEYLFPPIHNGNDMLDNAGRVKDFNILDDTPSVCHVRSKTMMQELISIFHQQANDLSLPLYRSPPRTFELIEEQDYPHWSLKPSPSISGWSKVIERYYLQNFDPREDIAKQKNRTIIHFDRSGNSEDMSFRLLHFSLENLSSEHQLMYSSLGRINLDKKGMAEFIWLLELNWLSLYSPPEL